MVPVQAGENGKGRNGNPRIIPKNLIIAYDSRKIYYNHYSMVDMMQHQWWHVWDRSLSRYAVDPSWIIVKLIVIFTLYATADDETLIMVEMHKDIRFRKGYCDQSQVKTTKIKLCKCVLCMCTILCYNVRMLRSHPTFQYTIVDYLFIECDSSSPSVRIAHLLKCI